METSLKDKGLHSHINTRVQSWDTTVKLQNLKLRSHRRSLQTVGGVSKCREIPGLVWITSGMETKLRKSWVAAFGAIHEDYLVEL